MWSYSQSSGELRDAAGQMVAIGYAGHESGLNNPSAQAVHDIGPIPQGFYSIGPPRFHPRLGPDALELTPHDGNEMFGRSGFYIHADNMHHLGEHLASDGCIVIEPESERVNIWKSGDTTLKVTE